MNPHQQGQACLSTGAGGLGLPSTVARRMSASIGNRVETLPEVLADLTGPLGYGVRRELPESNIVAQVGGSLTEIRRHIAGNEGSNGRNHRRLQLEGDSRRMRWQVSPPNFGWNGCRGGPGRNGSRGRHTLAAHDAVTTIPGTPSII